MQQDAEVIEDSILSLEYTLQRCSLQEICYSSKIKRKGNKKARTIQASHSEQNRYNEQHPFEGYQRPRFLCSDTTYCIKLIRNETVLT
jgi:hypothetical protein